MVTLFSILRNCQTVFIVTASFCIPTSNVWRFQFLHILTSPCYCPFDYSGFELVSHCGFGLHFPNDECCWVIFHAVIGHLNTFFREMPIYVLCPFLILLSFYCSVQLFCCKNSLYIPDTSHLLAIWFASIFSHSVGCLFTFLIMSFDAVVFW